MRHKTSIHDIAEAALERPSNFAYSGDLPLFDTWGLTLSTNRDADTLTDSNWQAALERMREEHPDGDWQVCRFNHWGVGWVKQLAVKVLTDEDTHPLDDDPIDNDYTPEFQTIVEMKHEMENYPVLDEEDLMEREHEEEVEFWVNWGLKTTKEAVLEQCRETLDCDLDDEDTIRDWFDREPLDVLSDVNMLCSPAMEHGGNEVILYADDEDNAQRILEHIMLDGGTDL